MLRACARALLREVGRRWEARGEIQCDSAVPIEHAPGGELPAYTDEQLLEQHRLGKLAVDSQEPARMACLTMKFLHPSIGGTLGVQGGLFPPRRMLEWFCYLIVAYACNLADTMGFPMAAGLSEKVRERACKEVQSRGGSLVKTSERFMETRARAVDTPGIFVLPVLGIQANTKAGILAGQMIVHRISRAAALFLSADLMSVLWLTDFRVTLARHFGDAAAERKAAYLDDIVNLRFRNPEPPPAPESDED